MRVCLHNWEQFLALFIFHIENLIPLAMFINKLIVVLHNGIPF